MTSTIQEARRYVDNAKEILSEKGKKEDGYYQDRKYVKLAGHAAYSGVLVALDGLFAVKNKRRKSVEWYQEQLGKVDRKALNSFNAAYDTLHLAMGYDGNLTAKVSAAGIEMAEYLIEWAENRVKLN